MNRWIPVLAALALAFAAAPAADASGCSSIRYVLDCDVQVGDTASASVWIAYAYFPTAGEGDFCVDTNSHPGFEECNSWKLP